LKRLTMADIAKAAGVSKGAVSYALNGRPGVSELTRQRVMRIAEELGWVPNTAARALSAARADAVGFVLARPARILGLEPFFMQLISGIEGELAGRSLALVLQVVPDVRTECEVYRRWWAERRIDGVIVVDLRVEDPRVHMLAELGLPAVIAGGQTDELVGIWPNERPAMRSLVQYLAALGHTRIARVAGLPELRHTATRTEEFQRVTTELNLSTTTLYGDYSGEQGTQLTRRLLSARPRPTAILYDNDVMAVAGLSVATEMGIAVPQDLSIVAWDDSPLCQLVSPPLTALTRDVAAFGARAVQALAEVLAGANPPSTETESPTLVVRGSTAAVPRTR